MSTELTASTRTRQAGCTHEKWKDAKDLNPDMWDDKVKHLKEDFRQKLGFCEHHCARPVLLFCKVCPLTPEAMRQKSPAWTNPMSMRFDEDGGDFHRTVRTHAEGHQHKNQEECKGRGNHRFWRSIFYLYYLLCCKESESCADDINLMREIQQSDKNTREWIQKEKEFVSTKHHRLKIWTKQYRKAGALSHMHTQKQFDMAHEVLRKCEFEIDAYRYTQKKEANERYTARVKAKLQAARPESPQMWPRAKRPKQDGQAVAALRSEEPVWPVQEPEAAISSFLFAASRV
jgi:hypothetical protein